MPFKRKKQFIDKKKSVTFQLVHRSQKDPLAADEDAPQRVLVPIEQTFHKELEKYDEIPEIRWSEQRAHGIGFEDDYDYLQHLKVKEEIEDQVPIWVAKDDGMELFPEDEEFDETSSKGAGFMDVEECIKSSEGVKMLSMMFGSRRAEEEDVGLLHRAIPPIGPQPTWDPDVVAGLDEDFDFGNPNNLLDDDFISRANCFDDRNKQHTDNDDAGWEDVEEDVDSCSIGSDDFSEDNFSEEETKSRFTAYSMTSSVIRRNEHLSHLDDRFEKFFEGYDDDRIGDLSQLDIEGPHPVHDVDETRGMKLLLGIIDEEDEKKANADCEETDELKEKKRKENLVCRYQQDDVDNVDNLIEIVKEEPHVKWDCESIISTYSNLYNHPKVIQDAPTSKKSKDVTQKKPVEDTPLEEETDINTSYVDKSIFQRNKNESKEEKMLRKKMVKEAKKERRQEKKATKTAFKVEQTRQNKQLINMQQNLSGIRIS